MTKVCLQNFTLDSNYKNNLVDNLGTEGSSSQNDENGINDTTSNSSGHCSYKKIGVEQDQTSTQYQGLRIVENP